MNPSQASTEHVDNNRLDWLLARRFFRLEGTEQYLKRARNEPEPAYKERKRQADIRPYTRDVLSRLSGALMARYGQSERSQPGLVPEWFDTAGAGGEDYSLVLSELASKLLLFNETFLLVRPQGVDVLSPLQVPSYDLTSEEPSALVVGERETGSVLEGFDSEPVYTHYRPEGWTTYSGSGDVIGTGDYSGSGDAFITEDGGLACPVLRIEMPWDVQFGLSVARAHAAIYRKEADLDAAERNAAHSILALDVGGDKETFEWISGELAEGNVAIPQGQNGGHEFLSPDMSVTSSTRETLGWKIDQLYRVTYNSLDNVRREQSATEAAINHQTGMGAALSVLAQTVQSAETSLLPIAAQSQDMSRSWEPADADWPADWSETQVSLPDPSEEGPSN